MRHIFTASILGILVLPSIVLASPIVRSGDAVSVEADQVLEGDFYGLGSTVLISGSALHDVHVAGGSVTVNAPVGGDLVILGGTVQVHALVEDDVRVLGGDVVIADHVKGDVVVLGGKLNILSTAMIDGDLLFFGGEVDVSGMVSGSVVGKAERVRIDAGVGGNVSITANQSFSLGDRAEILGNLEYASRADIARSQGAVVVGDINKNTIQEKATIDFYTVFLPLLVILFAALSAYLLFKAQVQELTNTTKISYGVQGLVGLAVFLSVPFISFVLIASVLGFLVGAFLLVAYVLLVLITLIVSGIVCGTLLLVPLTKSTRVTALSTSVGAIVFGLLHFIPYIGILLTITVLLIVMGGISTRIYRIFR